MHQVSRTKTLLAAAIATTLVGSVLVYFGVGSARYAEIGWFEYIREMVEVVDAVSVEPAGFVGLILVSAGVLAAAFLLGIRWSTPRRELPESAERSQALTYVWWGTAALTAIGLLIGIISIIASPPYSPNYNVNGPGAEPPTFIEDWTLLFKAVRVASATFIGAALVRAGLLVMSFLLGRYGLARSAPSALLAVATNRSFVWWGGVALAVIGLAAVVIFRVTAPPPPTFDGEFVPLLASGNYLLVLEGPELDIATAGVYLGTGLALLGLLVMSVVIGLSHARRRAPVTTAADD